MANIWKLGQWVGVVLAAIVLAGVVWWALDLLASLATFVVLVAIVYGIYRLMKK